MTTTNIETMFEAAVRQKLRFDSKVGQLSVEDLWDLPLTSTTKVNLDQIAIALNAQLKSTEESFVTGSAKDATTQLRFDIVRHVITVRMRENSEKVEAVQKRQKREQLDELIARKQTGALESLSVEQLEAMRNAL